MLFFFFKRYKFVFLFERLKLSASTFHEFSEEFDKLQPAGMNKRAQCVKRQVKNVPAYQNYHHYHRPNNGNHITYNVCDKIDGHGNDTRGKPQSQQS